MTTTSDRGVSGPRTAERVTPAALAAEEARLRRNRRRFARRQRARRWMRWRPLLLVVLVLGLLSGGVWAVFFSTLLAADTVRIQGVSVLREAEVRRVADVPLGEPLARVDLEAILGRVRALAPVKSVDVTRSWPHDVVIDITERVPVAAVEVGSRYQAVDSEGVLFRGYDKRPADLPLVVADSDVGQDALEEGAEVASDLPGALRARIDHVQVDSVDEITLALRNGREVAWGSGESSTEKAQVLTGLLAVAPDASAYDVSVPAQPAWRP